MHIPLINRLFFIHNPQFITKCRRTLALECFSSALGVANNERHYMGGDCSWVTLLRVSVPAGVSPAREGVLSFTEEFSWLKNIK